MRNTALYPNWPSKAEYRYTKYTNAGAMATTLGISIPAMNSFLTRQVDTTVNIARVGLNYRFGG